MNKLYAKNGNLLSTQETILSETMNQYKTLYSEKQVEDVCLNDFFFKRLLSKSFQTLNNNK